MYVWNLWQYWKRQGIKGPPPSFLGRGNSKELSKTTIKDALDKWSKEYGDVFGIYFLWLKPVLIVSDPEMVKEICVKQFSRFQTTGRFNSNSIFGKMSKDFMTTQEGKKWKRQRSTITPFFSASRLTNITPIVSKSAEKAITDLVGPLIPTGESIDVSEFCQSFAMSAIMASGFSIDAESSDDLMKQSMGHGRAFMDTNVLKSMWLMFIPESIRFRYNMTPYPSATDKFFRDLSGSLMENAQAARSRGEQVRPDFISFMTDEIISEQESVEAVRGFTKDELIATSLLFVIAGWNTTSDVLGYVLYDLALHQDFQEELVQHIQNAMKEGVTYDTLKNVKLLDATIKESQRIHPILPVLMRECDEDTLVKGVPIQKGTLVCWNVVGIHNSEVHYSEPETFKPDRFEGNESNTLQDDAWYGFGYGPRACPGVRWAFLAMKILLVRLLMKYRVVKTNKTLNPDEWQMKVKGVEFKPSKPLLVGFEKRE